MKLTKVRLYGHLGKQFGRMHTYDIASPYEAARALGATIPGFHDYVRENCRHGFRVIVGKDEIRPEQMMGIAGGQTIKIVPCVRAGKDELLQIGIGLVIIWASGGFGAPAVMGAGAASVGMAVGTSMVLGGLASMMSVSPITAAYNNSDSPQSYLFGGANSQTQAGGPVPVLYGELEIPGVLISGGIVPEPQATSHFGLLGDGTGAWSGDGLTVPYAASKKES